MLDHQTIAALSVCCVHLRDELKFEQFRKHRQKIELLRKTRRELTAANQRLRAEVIQLGLRLQGSRETSESQVRALMAIHQLAEEAHMCALPLA